MIRFRSSHMMLPADGSLGGPGYRQRSNCFWMGCSMLYRSKELFAGRLSTPQKKCAGGFSKMYVKGFLQCDVSTRPGIHTFCGSVFKKTSPHRPVYWYTNWNQCITCWAVFPGMFHPSHAPICPVGLGVGFGPYSATTTAFSMLWVHQTLCSVLWLWKELFEYMFLLILLLIYLLCSRSQFTISLYIMFS